MGCFTFVKLMMVLLNLLILLGGLTLLSTGVWVALESGSLLQILGPFTSDAMQFVHVGFFCIAVGSVLVLLGILGCIGAQKESKCLLLTFFSVVMIIFISEVAAAVVALAYSAFAEEILRSWATPALKDQYGSDPLVTKLWNYTMTQMNCCGFTNYTDFLGSRYAQESNGNLPPSCCRFNSSTCRPEAAQLSAVKGCFHEILKILMKDTIIVGGVAAGVGALEVLAMIVSMYLYCHLDNRVS
ncbi:tetraspanin-1 [Polymixia lowei]